MEESPSYRFLNLCVTVVVAWIFFANIPFVVAQEWTDQAPPPALKGPWSDKSLPPDQRADLLIQQMTLEEKLSLVHGDQGEESLKKWLGGAGYVPGVPRLGIPALQMSDGRSGCRQHRPHGALRHGAPLGAGERRQLGFAVVIRFRRAAGQGNSRPGIQRFARRHGQHHSRAAQWTELRVPW